MASRLTEMQTRFKQKQLQEKEDKLKKLLAPTEQRTAQASKSINERVTNGSVLRYTVEERKQKAGIDRSYPLKPLKVNTTVTARQSLTTTRSSLNNNPPLVKKNTNVESFGCDDLNENRDISKESKRKEPKLMRCDEEAAERTEVDAKSQSVLKKPLKGISSRAPIEKSSSSPSPVNLVKPRSKASSTGSKISASSRVSPAVRPSTEDNLVECKNCNRRFLPDRLKVHEEICTKTAKKKRKTYDAVKHRVQGTDLEPFARRGTKTKVQAKPASPKKANWKLTHEEFINTIRAAKQTQAHLAKGGKLSDLPPPPPSTNPDYVQCPNCGRKFNESAAARHIPKCANYSFNKAKAGPGAKAAAANRTRAMR